MFKNREDQPVPVVTFKLRDDENNWLELTSDKLFSGKTVIVFSLPGAFTPTCSSARANALKLQSKEYVITEVIIPCSFESFLFHAEFGAVVVK